MRALYSRVRALPRIAITVGLRLSLSQSERPLGSRFVTESLPISGPILHTAHSDPVQVLGAHLGRFNNVNARHYGRCPIVPCPSTRVP